MESIQPRLIDDRTASEYTQFSLSWFRNTRYLDVQRDKEGLPPMGPPWFHVGRKVRYDISELNAWIDSIRDGTNPAYQDEAAA